MTKIVSLCKRRGFVYQSSEIYGGLRSCYDFGPLGVELKRNISQAWWQSMVYERDDIYGLDASIMMHPDVWRTSGHASSFSDPMVDCKTCKERFRADKAPRLEPGTEVSFSEPKTKKQHRGIVSAAGIVCPQCGSPELSEERQFNLMFRTVMGALDPLLSASNEAVQKGLCQDVHTLWKHLETAVSDSSVFLRPETAQAMFVQFLNIQQSMSAKIPFGICQIGKSFRNEIITEHFIFRSCEFEQMELEYFVQPGKQKQALEEWTESRLAWYRNFLRPENAQKIRKRAHADDELAHYADACYDIEYEYPWGWGELEGVASRTDYDLKKHAAATGVKLSYFDPHETDPETGKVGYRFTPYVVEPAAGLTRSVLCFLCDAYQEETIDGRERAVLKLHPRLAPVKVALLPLVKKDGQPEWAEKLAADLRKHLRMSVRVDDSQSIGKRYAKHDEIGTPFAVTIDAQSIQDQTVTIRDRDSTRQERLDASQLSAYLRPLLEG